MEPLYDGRVSLKVGTEVRNTWALPKWEYASAGRLPSAALHIPDSWVPSRLCRFMPYEQGWLVQLGRARGRISNKYLGDRVFLGRTIVALQPGRTRITFPELDDLVQLGVVIGAGQADGLDVLQDRPEEGDRDRLTRYAADRVQLTDHQRETAAVVFRYLLMRHREPPVNAAKTAAAALGRTEQAVQKTLLQIRDKVNKERWLNLRTTDQLGHYMVNLSRNLTIDDLPPAMRDDQGGYAG